jgi:hypothetical protein
MLKKMAAIVCEDSYGDVPAKKNGPTIRKNGFQFKPIWRKCGKALLKGRPNGSQRIVNPSPPILATSFSCPFPVLRFLFCVDNPLCIGDRATK